MYLNGRIFKEGKFWLIEVPVLDVMTQGRTKNEAYDMLRDAIEMLVDKKGFKIRIIHTSKDSFIVGSNDDKVFIAFILKRQRVVHGLSLADMARRLHKKSRNAYRQYEQDNNINPTIAKLQEILRAMSSNVIIKIEEQDDIEKVA